MTAVLFEVAEAGEPGDTLEAPAIVVPDPDEADTLHPEDGVAAAAGRWPSRSRSRRRRRTSSDTMIVSAAALAARAGCPRTARSSRQPRRPSHHEESAPLWRYALALLVIVALAGVIYVLVTKGLAR